MTRGTAFDAMPMPALARRSLLTLPALLPLPARALSGGSAVVLAPGPEDGPAAGWARRALRGLARGLPRATSLRVTALGGPDGVTAANRFAAVPGEAQALVLNGHAALVRLSGSGRVRFDPAGWLPVMASWREALVAGRGPRPEGDAARSAPPVRLLLPAPCSAEAAVLLAIEALGIPAQPAVDRDRALAQEDAFAGGSADALLLTGPDAAPRARSLGAVPWFTVNAPESGPAARILPDLADLLPASPLRDAARSAIATAQWQAGLVLPLLTDADSVALWRQGASRWQEAERADPQPDGAPLIGPEVLAALSLAAPSADTLFAWREWLLRRMRWQAD